MPYMLSDTGDHQLLLMAVRLEFVMSAELERRETMARFCIEKNAGRNETDGDEP